MKKQAYHKTSLIMLATASFLITAVIYSLVTSSNKNLFATKEARVDNHQVQTKSYLVQGKKVFDAVSDLGAQITHDLSIINAVAANLTSDQINFLKQQGHKLIPNTSFETAGNAIGQRIYYSPASATQMTNASVLHDARVFGDGVTMVVLDSGVKSMNGIRHDVYGRHRVYGTYNAITNKINQNDDEESGHGTHVASVALNSERDINNNFYGVAPNTRLISVKAFDELGKGNYADVIRGIQWAIYYRENYNIRVMNLSFSAPPQSYYWEDPLNQAVMRAWQAGIVVVTSAGNKGTSAGGIGVPGNVPYVITVGSVTDAYTPEDYTDDRIASFSSSGPTLERFVKPDVVAPGGHLMGLMESKMQLATEHPEFHDGGKYFTMSGTSQSAGVVSGIAALMISLDPSLTPDDVKCRLMASAKAARHADGSWAYPPFLQGAGQVDAVAAVISQETGCANRGLNIDSDLDGTEHYAGPAMVTEDNAFYIRDVENAQWDGHYDKTQGYQWSSAEAWEDAAAWPDANAWRDAAAWPDANAWRDAAAWPDANAWRDAAAWPDANAWRDAAAWPDTFISTNTWVEQE